MLSCKHCGVGFGPNEHPYHSHQSGMRGWYHWPCFVAACRKANQRGANEIAISLAVVGRYDEPDFLENSAQSR